MRACVQVLAVLLALGAWPARAETDWFASVYTPGGIEIRADARVFSLFALLNRAGYDAGPLRREHPVPAYRYSPARTRVREALAGADPSVLQRAQAFFDAHPLPLERYLALAVRLEDGGALPAELRELEGLETLLDHVEAKWPVPALRTETFDDYRAAMRAYLAVADAPLQRAQQLLRLPESGPGIRLVVNLLAEEGWVRGFHTGLRVVVVVGPGRTPEVERVVREYARLMLPPQVGEQAQARWTAGPALLREAQALGAREATVGDYAVALLSRALALAALQAPDSAYEAAHREGYFGLKVLAGSFGDPRPVDAWALEGLARVGTGRAPRK
ncbi:hypothetical protein [Hyalangium rubrum]|uniref:Uncharacterized protein n=1 Tax=Hyalangium rubrum TaxID=3103134 RepID=A0ABU5HCD9_9BACT|nr:hypothetical protein [Hyalangium sp. s54d21]MDY7231123.1 hypothetical protein [Hyalangium sp. s54d21]